MCSLFGWLDYKGIIPDKVLKRLTQSLANAAEERGTDAAGISYVKDGKVIIFKRPKPAHRIRFNTPGGTKAVMGHTRMTTQGDEKHNYNNHPFPGRAGDMDFALAHNGMLYNDKELRKALNLPDTHIETDSYAAVQLIERSSELSFDSLRNMSEKVQCSFCFSILDKMGKLYIVKGSNPMTILHFESLGLFIYTSTSSIITKALKKSGLYRFDSIPIIMEEGQMLSIDRNGLIERAEFTPAPDRRFSKCNFGEWYDCFDDELYSCHEQMILEMCGMFGVDEDDVCLLLDYGYSADEVEEMLMDYTLLTDTLKAIKGEGEYYDCLPCECY